MVAHCYYAALHLFIFSLLVVETAYSIDRQFGSHLARAQVVLYMY